MQKVWIQYVYSKLMNWLIGDFLAQPSIIEGKPWMGTDGFFDTLIFFANGNIVGYLDIFKCCQLDLTSMFF